MRLYNYVMAWVAVKFGINTYHECCIGNGKNFTRVKPSETTHLEFNKSTWYLSQIFTAIPC